MDQNNNIIETEGLTKLYNHKPAVDNITFQVKEGEIFGFLGPNGAGKSTTLLMLLGLSVPTSGKARVCGLDPVLQAREIKKRVGYLPENVGFYNDLNAIESLTYIGELIGMDRSELSDRIQSVLKEVGLWDDAYKLVGAYSRGMKQRLGLAEVLLKNPELMFLDEPTLGLDPEGAARLVELIETLNKEHNITVLISSHNLFQVQKISHRVGIMINGRMVATGTVEELAKEKLGIGEEEYTLEQIYMKYFQEVS